MQIENTELYFLIITEPIGGAEYAFLEVHSNFYSSQVNWEEATIFGSLEEARNAKEGVMFKKGYEEKDIQIAGLIMGVTKKLWLD